jgi:hypothetical protein
MAMSISVRLAMSLMGVGVSQRCEGNAGDDESREGEERRNVVELRKTV